MGYNLNFIKDFRIITIVRVIVIAISFLALLPLLNYDYIFLSIGVSLLIVVQLFSLIRFLNRSNNIYLEFIESIKYSEFTQSFKLNGSSNSYERLKDQFNSVTKQLSIIRSQKEESRIFFENIIQHLGSAIIAFNDRGEVEVFNSSGKNYLRVNSLKNMDQLNERYPQFYKQIMGMDHGEKGVIKIDNGVKGLNFLLSFKKFQLNSREISLLSFNDIGEQLDDQEFHSWQKLIRVLTHEIMNSITPITSLTATLNELISEGGDDLNLEDLQGAIETISRRGEGLKTFIENYKNLSYLHTPKYDIINLNQLFGSIELMFRDRFEEFGINFKIVVDPKSLEVTADRDQIVQLLINLIKNSMDTVSQSDIKDITIKGELESTGRVIISVVDSGAGIPEKSLEKIFIPFYSTKVDGSGIGLSISKQIMKLHNGSISVDSREDMGTTICLKF